MINRYTLRAGFSAVLLAAAAVACRDDSAAGSLGPRDPRFAKGPGGGGGGGGGGVVTPPPPAPTTTTTNCKDAGCSEVGVSTGAPTVTTEVAYTLPAASYCDGVLSTLPAHTPAYNTVRLERPADRKITCHMVVDQSGLVSGEGLIFNVSNVTLDLNGVDIVSDGNAFRGGQAFGIDVENHGIIVGGGNVTVKNSSATPATYSGFTLNIVLGGKNQLLDGTSAGASPYGIRAYRSSPAAGVKVVTGDGVTIRNVLSDNVSADPISGLVDPDMTTGLSMVQGSGKVRVESSDLRGRTSSIRIRDSKSPNAILGTKLCWTVGPTFDLRNPGTVYVSGNADTGGACSAAP